MGVMVVWIGSVENVGGADIGVVWVLCCMGVLFGCVGGGVIAVDVGYDAVGHGWAGGAVTGVVGLASLW
jgi:hypothetical protein